MLFLKSAVALATLLVISALAAVRADPLCGPTFTCQDGKGSVPALNVCDSKKDCSDGSDERYGYGYECQDQRAKLHPGESLEAYAIYRPGGTEATFAIGNATAGHQLTLFPSALEAKPLFYYRQRDCIRVFEGPPTHRDYLWNCGPYWKSFEKFSEVPRVTVVTRQSFVVQRNPAGFVFWIKSHPEKQIFEPTHPTMFDFNITYSSSDQALIYRPDCDAVPYCDKDQRSSCRSEFDFCPKKYPVCPPLTSEEVPCAGNRFYCTDGNASIPIANMCDGKNDCVDGSDERYAICQDPSTTLRVGESLEVNVQSKAGYFTRLDLCNATSCDRLFLSHPAKGDELTYKSQADCPADSSALCNSPSSGGPFRSEPSGKVSYVVERTAVSLEAWLKDKPNSRVVLPSPRADHDRLKTYAAGDKIWITKAKCDACTRRYNCVKNCELEELTGDTYTLRYNCMKRCVAKEPPEDELLA